MDILVVIGIVVFSVVRQLLKSGEEKQVPIPEEILGDEFPVTEAAEVITAAKEEEKEKRPSVPLRTPPVPAPPTVRKETSPSVASSHSVRLHSREEARRAFLYSEIFNRKY